MMHQRRNLLAAQRGQAAIVGVIVLFMLALGMYTTYSLGRAVTEKIKLQNIADATAYSMAATEARTFNFIAFANRCQIAHYISLMAVQGLISDLTYTEGMLGLTADVLYDVQLALRAAALVLDAVSWLVPGAGQAALALRQAADVIEQAAERINDAYEMLKGAMGAIDFGGKIYTYMIYVLNWLYWAAGWTMAVSTFTLLAECGYSFAVRSDPSLQRSNLFLWPLFGVYNSMRFNNTFDPVGGAAVPVHIVNEGQGLQVELSYPRLQRSTQKSGDDDIQRAQRIMTELVNASRFDRYLVNRPLLSGLSEEVANANSTLDGAHVDIDSVPVPSSPPWKKDRVEDAKDYAHGHVDGAQQAIDGLFAVKEGASKLLSELDNLNSEGRFKQQIKDIDKRAPNASRLSRGTGMGSYDRMGYAKDHHWSVFAGVDQGFHCRYDRGNREFETPLNGITGLAGGFNYCFTKDGSHPHYHGDEDVTDTNHPWPGLAPFLTMDPLIHGLHGSRVDFNQPDVWVWLNRSPERTALTTEGNLVIRVTQGGISADLETDIGRQGMFGTGVLEGINALARGEAYYHRPGSWQEPPNFFNPYWRGRLAPAGIALQELVDQIPYLNQIEGIGQMIADNIVTH